jgi:hypothetical protein
LGRSVIDRETVRELTAGFDLCFRIAGNSSHGAGSRCLRLGLGGPGDNVGPREIVPPSAWTALLGALVGWRDRSGWPTTGSYPPQIAGFSISDQWRRADSRETPVTSDSAGQQRGCLDPDFTGPSAERSPKRRFSECRTIRPLVPVNTTALGLQRKGSPDIVFRRRGTSGWDDAVNSPEFSLLSRALGNPTATPNFNLVERSNLVSTFVLSQFLARRRDDISLARAGDLSLQQFADNDVIVVAPSFSDKTQSALPVRTDFIAERAGIRNLRPRAGEPQLYADPPDHQESDGEGLELISVLPGPMGQTTVVGFSGNHVWGVIGGVESLTDPAFARTLVGKLRASSGRIPPYYQIVIRIRYRDGTPTSASYVAHRALSLTQNSVETNDSN